jgi:hypothetical protein
MTTNWKEREAQVLDVLAHAKEPLGPAWIGAVIGKPWCSVGFLGCEGGLSASVHTVLKRIGAVRHKGGKYTKPEGQEQQGQEGKSRG